MKEFSPQEEAHFCSLLRSELKKSKGTVLTPKIWANVAQKLKRSATELEEQFQTSTQYKGKISFGLPFIGINTPSPSPAKSTQKKRENKNSEEEEETMKKTPKRKIEFTDEVPAKKPKKSPNTILKSFELTPKKKETPKQTKEKNRKETSSESSSSEEEEPEPVKKSQTPSKNKMVEEEVSVQIEQDSESSSEEEEPEPEPVKKSQTPSKNKTVEEPVSVQDSSSSSSEEEEKFSHVRISKFSKFIQKMSNETNVKDQMKILHALYINSGDILNTILFLKNEDYDDSKIWKVEQDKKIKENDTKHLNKSNTEIEKRKEFLKQFE
jgi:hypothetical protein